jgi:hypothetical protein
MQMKTKTENLLPQMMCGTVHQQFKKCGKSNCRCSKGELHGAYYYHFVRIGGKLKKRYLKAHQVKQIEQACLFRRSQQKEQRLNSINAWQQLREVRETLRTCKNLY